MNLDDIDWTKEVGRSFMIIRVEIDVEKLFVPGFWVSRRGSGKIWAEVKYEKLADFCYCCGMLGHVMKNCVKEDMEVKFDGNRRGFGLWMRAATIRKWDRGSKVGGSWRGKGDGPQGSNNMDGRDRVTSLEIVCKSNEGRLSENCMDDVRSVINNEGKECEVLGKVPGGNNCLNKRKGEGAVVRG